MAGKSPKKKSGKSLTVAEERYKEIKSWVNFKYTGTPSNKRRIKKYHEELRPLLNQPHVKFSTRSKANFKLAYNMAGFETRLPGIKAIPVATKGVENVRVKVKGKRMYLEGEYTTEEIIPLDAYELAEKEETYIEDVLQEVLTDSDEEDEEGDEHKFLIAAGKHWIDRPVSAENLPARIKRLMLKYEAGTSGAKKHKSTYRDWLHSLRHIHTQKQISVEEFMRRSKARKTEHKAERKKAKQTPKKKTPKNHWERNKGYK